MGKAKSSQKEGFLTPMFANCLNAQNDVDRKCSRLGKK